MKWKYVWDGGLGLSDSDCVSAADLRKDISHMSTNGCRTKKLKSKMRVLHTLLM